MKTILFCLSFLLSTQLAFAQVKVNSSLDRDQGFVGEPLQFQIRINGARQGVEVTPPQVPGLEIEPLGPPSSTSQTTIINGSMTRFVGLVYTYRILPLAGGKYQLPAFQVQVGKQSFYTDPVEIVIRDLTTLEGKKTIRLQLIAPKTQVYAGEEVRFRLRWELLEDINEYDLRLPLVERKDIELDLVEESQAGSTTKLQLGPFQVPFYVTSESQAEGTWTVYWREFRFFPLEPGEFAIQPARVTAMAVRGYQQQTDFFGRVVRSPRLVRRFARSNAVPLKILPLPLQGRPAIFKGAVGRFRARVTSPFADLQVGDALELTWELTGKGRLRGITPPDLSFLEKDFQIAPWSAGEQEKGKLRFTTKLRPKRAGALQVPPLPFAYFNPEKKAYEQALTQALALNVSLEKNLDLSHLRPGSSRSLPEARKLKFYGHSKTNPFHPAWFALFLLPVGVTLALRQWAKRGQKVVSQSLGPNWQRVQQGLRAAEQSLEKPELFYQHLWGLMEQENLPTWKALLEERRYGPGRRTPETCKADLVQLNKLLNELQTHSPSKAAP